VRRATPPNCVWLGEGRINAFVSRASRSMRVLSPKMDPPDRVELGSTASTATLWPKPVSIVPKLSINVDLPTPGVPDSPMRSPSRAVPKADNSAAASAR